VSNLGNAITTLQELRDCSIRKKSVIVPSLHCWSKPRPAAVVINLQGSIIVKMFECGIFEYKKEAKK